MIWLFLFLLTPLSAEVWQEGPYQVFVDPPSNKLSVGDQVTLDIAVEYPPNTHVNLKEIRDHIVKNQELFPKQLKLTEEVAFPEEKRLELTFQATHAGHFVLALEEVTFLKDGKPTTVLLPAFQIHVTIPEESLTGGTPADLLPFDSHPLITLNEKNRQDLLRESDRNLRQVTPGAERLRRPFPWRLLLAGLALAALGFTFRKGLIRLAKLLSQEILTPADPKEKALKALQSLEYQKLPKKKLFEKYYTEVTAIVRRFIEEAYGLPAVEQTTEEFLIDASQSSRFTEDTRALLQEFLGYADLVKFAKESPSQSNCNDTLASAKRFIDS